MAKRTRGSNRPGQRQSARTQSQPANRPSGSLSRDEEARAADLESQIVARERVADIDRSRARDRAKSEPTRSGRAGGQGLLAVHAAKEYDYLVRDIRRIVTVGGLLAAIMAALYVLVDVFHVVRIS
ncbi:MAG TPA: hypothetical protein VF344_01870 [Candidatus Limnocylindrales bacterium]